MASTTSPRLRAASSPCPPPSSCSGRGRVATRPAELNFYLPPLLEAVETVALAQACLRASNLRAACSIPCVSRVIIACVLTNAVCCAALCAVSPDGCPRCRLVGRRRQSRPFAALRARGVAGSFCGLMDGDECDCLRARVVRCSVVCVERVPAERAYCLIAHGSVWKVRVSLVCFKPFSKLLWTPVR